MSLGATTHVEATLEAEGATPLPLQADASADMLECCVTLSVAVLVSAPVGASACVSPLTVSGQRCWAQS